MWRALSKVVTAILTPKCHNQQQLRTTFILKRRHAPFNHKEGSKPKRLRNKHFIYDLVKDTNVEKQPNIEVILTQYVEGLGQKGQRVAMPAFKAYNRLLVPGYAVYASPEMVEKYKNYDIENDEDRHSSPSAARTIKELSRCTLSVTMSKDTAWTLGPWHIRNCFRRSGFHVPDEAITLPSKPISGPNMDLHGKEFYVIVTVNNLETVNVRCILYQWAADVLDRIPPEHNFFKRLNEPIFPEDADALEKIPSRIRVANLKDTN